MAERIDFTKLDRNDPRFLELDPNNPNINISGSKFDPTDPTADVKNPASASAKYNEFLKTANIGDTFDFGDGTVTKFAGFNKMGTPMIQTIESPERQNWRGTMSGATSFADAVSKLTGAGFSKQFAEYLTLQSGTDFMDQEKYLTANRGSTPEAIGAMADGTPIYGYDANGKPVTSPTGDIVSTTQSSSTDGTANFSSGALNLPAGVKVVSTYSDPTTGDVTAVLSNGQTKVLAKSGTQDAQRKSAYDLLYQEFNNLGIGALVPELKTFIEDGVSPAEFTLRLRQTESYKKRFAANAQRVAKGLRALSEAEYISLEDQYQNVMREYGLPETYYSRGEMGKQEGFEKFIAGDVSAAELEDRISIAQKRVLNANPEVTAALKQFYPGISNGDILAYTLDPSKALQDINRKVTAAEIGGAAVRSGLTTSVADAEYLQRYGVTKEQAEQGYQSIAQTVPRASQLADIYKQGPYTQATAEQEMFNLPGQVEAQRQRKKLTELETSAFSGRAGMGALARERAGAF